MSRLQAPDFAGSLRLAPGQARPHNLISSRRDWAALLTKGVPAADVAARLASLYSLCGESHRLCAQRAVAAAQGVPNGDARDAAQVLRLETAREHVRRIALDWPVQLAAVLGLEPAPQQMQAWLPQCPLFQAGAAQEPDWLPWLSAQVLGDDARHWLDQWEQDPPAWLAAWSARTPLGLPRLLHRVQPVMNRVMPASPFLRVHAHEAELHLLADTLRRDPGFARQPVWRGGCAETGTWTRLHQQQPGRVNTAWLRWGARLAELVRLALPDEPGRCGAQWLALGSLPTAPRSGLGWVEMARGLLVHHVELDAQGGTVRSCQVLAPTEWNFHARGAVAQALEGLTDSADARREIHGIVSAYDPCVKHEFTGAPDA